jgi:hypothetical protein
MCQYVSFKTAGKIFKLNCEARRENFTLALADTVDLAQGPLQLHENLIFPYYLLLQTFQV